MSWQPAKFPEALELTGKTIRLAPLVPDAHASALFAQSHGRDADPALWQFLTVGPFKDLPEFTSWLEACARSTKHVFFALIDAKSSVPCGMASYMRINPDHGVIEIGQIWFGPALKRTPPATEAILLLARHAFEDLGYRRLEWKCDALNQASRRAAERLGFRFEGLFRQHMIVKGRSRDTAWFAMLDEEWPVARASMESWLAAENFENEGRQRQSLAAIRADRSRRPIS